MYGICNLLKVAFCRNFLVRERPTCNGTLCIPGFPFDCHWRGAQGKGNMLQEIREQRFFKCLCDGIDAKLFEEFIVSLIRNAPDKVIGHQCADNESGLALRRKGGIPEYWAGDLIGR